jgi:hypothetical protein
MEQLGNPSAEHPRSDPSSLIEKPTIILEQYVGPYNPHHVIVLADSGYDDKKIQNAIAQKKWAYVITLKKIEASGRKKPMQQP